MPFRISLDPPSHGWLPICIDLFELGKFECAASDTPNDFLGELTYAIYRVLQFGAKVSAVAHVEPGAYEFAFSRIPPKGDVILEIIEHDDLEFALSNPGNVLIKIGGLDNGETVCKAFLFAIEELKTLAEPSVFRSRTGWAWSFPESGLYNIKLLLEGWPQNVTTNT